MALTPDTQITPGDHTTVTTVLDSFDAAGFGPTLFAKDDGTVHCTECGASSEPSRIQVEAFRRLEGESEPDEMQAVVAATCPSCGKPGTMVLHYGPTASSGDSDVLAELKGLESASSAPVSPMEVGTKGVPPVAPA